MGLDALRSPPHLNRIGPRFRFSGDGTDRACRLLAASENFDLLAGVWIWVNGPNRILQVPIWLAVGEFTGIALIWIAYARRFGLPKPVLGFRFLGVFLKRGRSIGLIHLCQAVIVSSDIIVVGLMSRWADVGRYSAPHRIISSVMAFGLIFQQVVFPSLSRFGVPSDSGRHLLDYAVPNPGHGFHSRRRWTCLLAEPLVRFLFPPEYHHTGLLLGLGVWRALYQPGVSLSGGADCDEPRNGGAKSPDLRCRDFSAVDRASENQFRDARGLRRGSDHRRWTGGGGLPLLDAARVPACRKPSFRATSPCLGVYGPGVPRGCAGACPCGRCGGRRDLSRRSQGDRRPGFRFQSAGTGDPHSAPTRQQTASRAASKRRAEIEEESEPLA